MKKILAIAGMTLFASQFVSAGAEAAPCTTAGYSSTYSGACSGNAASASSAVTSSETVAIATAATAGLVSDRLSALSIGGNNQTAKANASGYQLSYSLDLDEDGKSAGDGSQKFGVWANVTGSRFLFDKASSEFDGNLMSGMVGVDYRITDHFVAGIGFGYEQTEIDTTFNEGNEESKGWTVAPYAVYSYNKNYSVNLSGGFSQLSYDMDRKDQQDKNLITGETDADRWFGALNLNGNWTNDNLVYGANIGTLYTQEKKDGFTEVGSGATTVAAETTKIGRASIGGNIGYEFFDMMTPYVKAKYSYDYQDGGSADRNTANAGLGVNFALGSSVTAGIEANASKKGDFKEAGGSASLRVNF